LNRNITSLLFFLYLSVYSGHASAWNILTDKLDVRCQQSESVLNCTYRPLTSETTADIFAKSNGINLEVNKTSPFPEAGDTTAILFLVDTSDPNRQNVIEKNRSHIKDLLTALKPHNKVGLASFDKAVQFLSPVGTSRFLLTKSIDSLNATGKTTELYRNLIKAIVHLKSFDADRKIIILMSDGQAEDKAYFHSDVIKSARKSGIIINSIGYPRSISLSVSLQTIRRLSEETGGSYIETDMSYELPSNKLNLLVSNLDNGGAFSVELDSLSQNNPAPNKITLSFSNANGTENINVPVRIKVVKKPVQRQPSIIATEVANPSKITLENNPPIQIVTKQTDNQTINLWLWYGLPAAFIIIIIFILITLFLLWNRRPETKIISDSNYKPYAYLIADDGNETRYPITRTIWRIGRSKDNELTLNDTSLSRRHAEIHRNSNGTFDIIDMNSMNGVYINNEKIGKSELHEGDVLEIGDIFLHFTQLASDYSLEESTVMQKTKVPITH
jgi:FHA domain-containing protein/von Willebrand factor type A domain-containing protein